MTIGGRTTSKAAGLKLRGGGDRDRPGETLVTAFAG